MLDKQLAVILLAITSIWAGEQEVMITEVQQFQGKPWLARITVPYGQNGLWSSLEKENFYIKLDGKPVAPLSVQLEVKERQPVAVVFAIDASLSMEQDHLDTAKKLMIQFLVGMKPDDRMAILGFHDDVWTVAEFTDSREKVRSQIIEMKNGGSLTVLNKAMFKGLQLLGDDALPLHRVLVVISDGKNEGQGYMQDDVVQMAQTRGIPIFGLGLSKENRVYFDSLERIAGLTGGWFVQALKLKSFEPFMNGVEAPEERDYFVSFEPQDNKHEILEISVSTDSGVLHSSFKLKPDFEKTIDSKDHREKSIKTKAKAITPELNDHKPVQGLKVPMDRGYSSTMWVIVGSIFVLTPILLLVWMKGRRIENEKPGSQSQGQSGAILSEDGRQSQLLLEVKNEYQHLHFVLTESETWIGGNRTCNLRIEDPMVSNHHALLRWTDEGLLLMDNQSTNGTWMNGESLGGDPVSIGIGQEFFLGNTAVVVKQS